MLYDLYTTYNVLDVQQHRGSIYYNMHADTIKIVFQWHASTHRMHAHFVCLHMFTVSDISWSVKLTRHGVYSSLKALCPCIITHTHKHTYTHTHTHTHTHTKHTHAHTHTHSHTLSLTHTRTHTHASVCVCARVCLSICLCTCVHAGK